MSGSLPKGFSLTSHVYDSSDMDFLCQHHKKVVIVYCQLSVYKLKKLKQIGLSIYKHYK